jgi:hypothetical protein
MPCVNGKVDVTNKRNKLVTLDMHTFEVGGGEAK